MRMAEPNETELTSSKGVTKSAGGSHVACLFTGEDWIDVDRERMLLSSKWQT